MAVYNVRDGNDQDSYLRIHFSGDLTERVVYTLGDGWFQIQDRDKDSVEFYIRDLEYLIKALQKLQEVITG